MGLLGYALGRDWIFFFVVFLYVLSIACVLRISGRDIDDKQARHDDPLDPTDHPSKSVRAVLTDSRLLVFLLSVTLFHFANAAMLPLVGQRMAAGHSQESSLWMAACIITAQLNKKLAAKTLIVLLGLLIAFLLGAPMDLSAMTAAAVILVLANQPPAESFAGVDWALLMFFAGLFVVVAGVSKSEVGLLSDYLPAVLRDTNSFQGLLQFSVVSVVGSNLFGNVPFVMLLRDWVSHAHHAHLLWLLLAVSSTFAGNLTLVGSVANLIVAQGAKDECPLSFWSFLRVGVITTLVTSLIAVTVLYSYHLLKWI